MTDSQGVPELLWPGYSHIFNKAWGDADIEGKELCLFVTEEGGITTTVETETVSHLPPHTLAGWFHADRYASIHDHAKLSALKAMVYRDIHHYDR